MLNANSRTDSVSCDRNHLKSSLIICSRNRPKLLSETVDSVLSGTCLPTEIVIIDQSDSVNPELAQCRSLHGCEVRYLSSSSIGLSRARNEGIRAARYEILVFLDDDMYVCAQWFDKLVSAVRNAEDTCILTGQVLAAELAPGAATGFAPSLICDAGARVYRGMLSKDVLFAGNMAAWKTAFTSAGPFDEELGAGARFRSAEDNDFGFRLLKAGFVIRYLPEAVVYHRCWRPHSEYRALRWSYGFGQGAFYAKHLRLDDRYMLARLCKDVTRRTLLIPWLCIRNRHLASGEAMFVAGVLSGAVRWLWTRSRT